VGHPKLAPAATTVLPGAKKTATTTSRKSATSKGNVSDPSLHATTSSAEKLFRAAAPEIGLGRAMEILAAERSRMQAVIGGGVCSPRVTAWIRGSAIAAATPRRSA
jgi:hypothetical protein